MLSNMVSKRGGDTTYIDLVAGHVESIVHEGISDQRRYNNLENLLGTPCGTGNMERCRKNCELYERVDTDEEAVYRPMTSARSK